MASNDVFPELPGISWGVVKSPVWATKILPTSSGRELRGQFQSYPRWKFTLKFEFLREGWRGGIFGEMSTLVGFFNQRGGSFESFLFRDPEDYTVTDQALGVGDGVQVEYRFVRELGGFVEPIFAPENMWMYLDRGTALGKWYVTNGSRTNQFQRSDGLDNSYWVKSGVTATANSIAAPDGTTTADTITEDSANSGHHVYRTAGITPVVGSRYCMSWYVKPNGRTVVYLKSFWDGVNNGAEFTLSGAGTVNTVESGVEAAGIRALDNGWYRVWIVFTPTGVTTGALRLYLKNTVGGSVTYTGNGTSGIYATWAQLEVIDAEAPAEPTEYIPSVGGAPTTVAAAFTLSTYGYFSFATAPASGVEISWSGTFYFRVRFTHDVADFERFMKNLYSAKKIEFISEK